MWRDVKTAVWVLPYNAYMLFMVEMVWSVGFWVPVVPFYVHSVEASSQWVAWLQALQQVGIALAGWLWGAAADIVGADAAMIASTTFCGFFLIMSGCATDNIYLFAALRCAAGICSKQAAVNAYIFEVVPRHLHDIAMSFRLVINTAALLISASIVDDVFQLGEAKLPGPRSGFIAVFVSPGFALIPLLLTIVVGMCRDGRHRRYQVPAQEQQPREVRGQTEQLVCSPFHLLLRTPQYLVLLLAMFTIGFVGSAFNVGFTSIQHDIWKSPLAQVAGVSGRLFMTQGLIAVLAFRPAVQMLGEEWVLKGIYLLSSACMLGFLMTVERPYCEGLAVLCYVLGLGLLVQAISLGSLLARRLALALAPGCAGQAVGTAYGCIMFAAAGSCLFTGQLYMFHPQAPFLVCLALLVGTAAALLLMLTKVPAAPQPLSSADGCRDPLKAPLVSDERASEAAAACE